MGQHHAVEPPNTSVYGLSGSIGGGGVSIGGAVLGGSTMLLTTGHNINNYRERSV